MYQNNYEYIYIYYILCYKLFVENYFYYVHCNYCMFLVLHKKVSMLSSDK